jgi:hypothetical protein
VSWFLPPAGKLASWFLPSVGRLGTSFWNLLAKKNYPNKILKCGIIIYKLYFIQKCGKLPFSHSKNYPLYGIFLSVTVSTFESG